MLKKQELSPNSFLPDYNVPAAYKLSRKSESCFPGNIEFREMLYESLNLQQGSHFYISTDHVSSTEELLMKLLKEQKPSALFDYCYVYNFEEPDTPKLIQLPSGMGRAFKADLEESVRQTIALVLKSFSDKEIKTIEKKLKNEALLLCEKVLEELKEFAKSKGFATHMSQKGIYFIPVLNGKKISESEYDLLTIEEQEKILGDLNVVENSSKETIKKIKRIKRELKNNVKVYRDRFMDEAIENNLFNLRTQYKDHDGVIDYLNRLQQALKKSIAALLMNLPTEEHQQIQSEIENKNKFDVNLLSTAPAQMPVVIASKTNFYELFGKIEYINDGGNYVTDFTLIKPGELLKANGGFLILDVMDIISSKIIWDKLKKSLAQKKYYFENIRDVFGGIAIHTIVPEEIPLNIRVVLIGNRDIYELLYKLDPEFKELFPSHYHVRSQVEVNDANIAEFFALFNQEELSLPVCKRMVEFGIYQTKKRNMICTDTLRFQRVLAIAEKYRSQMGDEKLNVKHISLAENELMQPLVSVSHRLYRSIQNGQLLFQFTGTKIGEIHVLSVTGYDSCQLGLPIKLTVNTFQGDGNLFSAERDNKLGGRIFNKSLDIVRSYLWSTLSKTKRLPFSGQLSMEQVYGMIDGDSASLAILFAVLSSLAGVPIQQGIGITGSMNQHGDIQPIGSVSTKIEGFYQACKVKGLTGDQGVIVPSQNVDEIVLNSELRQSIAKHQFHIYRISDINEGAMLLMNMDLKLIIKKIRLRMK